MPQSPHQFCWQRGNSPAERKQSKRGVMHGGVGRWCDVRQSRIAFIEPGMSDASTSPRRNSGNRTDNRGQGRLHEPTDASRKQVEALASYGVPRGEIAKVAGVCMNTLAKHYGETLDIAATKANSLVAQSLFNRAVKGDGAAATSAAIFWLKVRAGWREKDVHEISGPNGGPIQMVDMSELSDAQLAALEPVLARLATHPIED